MPTYEYVCSVCATKVDYFQSMSDAPRRKCPECGKYKLVRQIGGGAGVLFRGAGFYQTDYRSDSYKKAESAEKPSTSDSTGDKKPGADGGGPCATNTPSDNAPKKR